MSLPYLPLTGGTITGNLTVTGASNIKIIRSNSPTGELSLCSNALWNEGSSISLYGAEHSSHPGSFAIRSGDGKYNLVGNNSGELQWINKNLVRSVGGATADSSGNVNAPYLSLNGGTFNNSTRLTSDSTRTQIIAGDGGGYCTFFKSNDSSRAGAAEIVARNSNNQVVHLVQATRTGCLADNKHIVRSVNNVNADANGNVSLNIAGVKVNNAVYADSAGSANSVAVCAYRATHYISDPNAIQATIRITTPNWGSSWYVLGHSNLGASTNNAYKTYTFSSIYGPNTNIVNESVNAAASTPNYRWSYSGIICIRLS